MRGVRVAQRSWPLRQAFAISRGTKTSAEVVQVEVEMDGLVGRGECVPYARYGESVDTTLDAIRGVEAALVGGADRNELQELLPPGAARNAVDCALWDLEALQKGCRVWQLAELDGPPTPTLSAYTISLGSPAEMEEAARSQAEKALLKIKLGPDEALESVAAVRRGAPKARLILDANEAWSISDLNHLLPQLAELQVELIEQPLPAGDDAALEALSSPPVPLAADESCHTHADVETLARRYQVVNIKLDKTGGLTEALRLKAAAQSAGMGIMVGCMVGSSLGTVPALMLTPGADFVDLDGPALLGDDHPNPVTYDAQGRVFLPKKPLWGGMARS